MLVDEDGREERGDIYGYLVGLPKCLVWDVTINQGGESHLKMASTINWRLYTRKGIIIYKALLSTHQLLVKGGINCAHHGFMLGVLLNRLQQ